MNGNVIEKSVFDSSEKLKSKFTYEYKLDNNKNWVQCIEFENSLPTHILVRKIEYHLDDQKISNKEEFSLDYFYKGYHSKNADTARLYFDKAILIDSSFVSAYCERGMRWRAKAGEEDYHKRQELFIADFTKAIEIDPNYVEAYRRRASILERGYGKGPLGYESNSRMGAIEDYNKLIEINPNDIDAYIKRAFLVTWRKDIPSSLYRKYKLNDLNKVLEIDPNNSEGHYSIGEDLMIEKEDYYGAIASFTKAVESDPTHDSAYSSRAKCKYKLKKLQRRN